MDGAFKGFRIVNHDDSDGSKDAEPTKGDNESVDLPDSEVKVRSIDEIPVSDDDSGIEEELDSVSDQDIDWDLESHVSASRRLLDRFGGLGGVTLQLLRDCMQNPEKHDLKGNSPEEVYKEVRYLFEMQAVVYFEDNRPKVQLPQFYEPKAFAWDTKTGMYYAVGHNPSGGYHNLIAQKRELEAKIEKPSLGFSMAYVSLWPFFNLKKRRGRKIKELEGKIQERILSNHELFVLQAEVPGEYVYSKFESFGELGMRAEFSNDYGEGTLKVQGRQITGLVVNGEPRTVETLPFEDMSVAAKR